MTAPASPERLGRRPKLTPELADRITQVMRAGSYRNVAAQFAGVGISTLSGWLARGRAAQETADRDGESIPAEEQRYVDFLAGVTQAEVHAEVLAATAFRSAVTEDWRAARDFLRYRVPDRWRASSTVTIRPEEAEQRIEHAVSEALAALGIEATPGAQPNDAGTADLLNELTDGLNLGPPRSRPDPEEEDDEP